jgi:surface protein
LFPISTVTNMGATFNGCYSLKSSPSFNTVSVTTMGAMFSNCYSLQSVSSLNTAAVTSMSSMFNNCQSLQAIPQFNTALVTDTSSMFDNCRSLCSGRTSGIRRAISYANCKLSTAALNDIFSGLGTASGAQTINIASNPGAATCNRAIATGKFWTVSG